VNAATSGDNYTFEVSTSHATSKLYAII